MNYQLEEQRKGLRILSIYNCKNNYNGKIYRFNINNPYLKKFTDKWLKS